MKLTKLVIYTFYIPVLAIVGFNHSQVSAAGDSGSAVEIPAVQSGEMYFPSVDAMGDVAKAISDAKESNRLVLVILGANWCHDSRALAARLYQEPLRAIIEQHYETVFIDVAYLDKGGDVISSIGPPIYYATPTVLIVDPVSARLLNADNRHQWGSANDISMEESVAYFQLMALADRNASSPEVTESGELQVLLAEIDAFEQAQAERLYQAYAVIGPMLKAYKDGENPTHFEDSWNEVRDFRMQVPQDVDRLRVEARERASSGEQDIHLEYPAYPAFSWDSE